jgi:SAM-dependent methyltransferase
MDKRANIYNDLVNWEKRKSLYPIHKKLLPFIYRNRECKDVNDILQNEFSEADQDILDIGCGVGNTLIGLASKIDISGYGISISDKEIALANENCLNNRLSDKIIFKHQSFDEPIAFYFDKAIAIESLKHSFDIGKTASNIYASAKTGASIFVIDDFFKGADEKYGNAVILKNDWNLVSIYSKKDFETAFEEAGFVKAGSIDLTDYVLPKSVFLLKLKILLFSFFEKISFRPDRRNLLAIFKSGFILELMFQQELFTYECLIFRKATEPDEHFSQ